MFNKQKTGLFLALFICLSTLARGQNFGNEWIDYNRKYYKIYVHADGIYRVSYNLMLSAGIPVQTIDPRSLQIFCKGVEQYIYVKGGTNNVLNPGDFIEFSGKMNDGTFDTQLYDQAQSQANPNYSLFCDSAVYFLTWNSSINNRRMMLENDVNFSSYTPVPFFNKISRVDYTSAYFNGEPYEGITDPVYTAGEGWFDNGFSLGGSISKNISTPGKYGSGNAEVDFILVGASDFSLVNPDHHVQIHFGNTFIDTVFEGYKMLRFNRTIPVSQLGSATTGFSFTSINDLGAGADRNTIPYIQIKYPHTPYLDNSTSFRFFVPDGIQAKSLFNFTGFTVNNNDTARLYDLSNHRRIKVVFDGTNYRALIPNAGNEKECYITSDGAITNVTKLVAVSANAMFNNYRAQATAENSDYIIISNSQLQPETENYRLYRNSTGYHTMLADVDQLYDQFSYGILKHPLGIRNFMRYAWANFPEKPKDLFLIGKAFRAGYDNAYVYRKSAYYWNQTLVPSLGNPPSDLLFTTGINDTMYTPAVPTGRLSARTADQVRIYLDKVKGYEIAAQTPQEWMKNVLHFGGGSNIGEQSDFQAYLNTYKNTIEDTLFGGYVRTYLKTNSDPIQINQSDSLKNIINGGVSLMTFFGHAGGTGFDVSIDNPAEYNNMDKYPFLLANSCYAGDLYSDLPNSSEMFVLIENKGVIGYLATIASGLPSALNAYSSEFYKNIAFRNYGRPVGKCIQQTIKSIQTGNLTLKETCLTMTLHGDPAIIINSFPKPDYMVNNTSVYFDPPNVTTEIDSFYINIITTNLGRAVADSFIVKLDRTFPDGTISTYYHQIVAPLFKDTLAVKLPVNFIKGIGLNKFRISLDAYNHMDEITKVNNITDVDLLIKSSDIVPVYPYKYAIIPALPVTLKASTGFAFTPPANYRFELDTTDAFNSPIKLSQVINHGGGVVTWNPVFPITTDSIVYFWRVSRDSANGVPFNWRETSFQYIQNKQGWGQAHFFQFKNDDYTYVDYNKPQRKFEFVNNQISLYCITFNQGPHQFTDQYYRLNGVQNYLWAYHAELNKMILAVIDPVSGVPWDNPDPSVPAGQDGFEFDIDFAASREKMRAFMDSVPAGFHILGWS
ncbi:MAG: C25 family cysteine peptidase, partial [Bacteroidota bacterium]